MNEIEQILKQKIGNFERKAPKGDGTIKGLQKRLKYLKNNLEKLTKDVNKSVNEHISNNDFSDNEIKKIEKHCADYISKAISSIF